MKKIFYLYILIFLSCDPGWFGLNEDAGTYSYHDGLALAWEIFFSEQNYDTAIAYVNMTIHETEDEEYYNSAYTALGWLYLFKSNIFFGSESDSLAIYRDRAFDEFSYIDDEEEAIIGYDTGCIFNFCCPNCFAKDRELGFLYMQIEEYFISSNEEQNSIEDLISALASFVNENDGLPLDQEPPEIEYDFMNGKPIGNNGETIDFGIDKVRAYLAHVYFRNGQFTNSCNELKNLYEQFPDYGYEDCELECDPNGGWNNTNLDELLDCFGDQELF